jgi:hypothetical protein
VTPANGELGNRLAALRADFAALGTHAAGAARSLAATRPPSTTLLDQLSAAGAAFAALRSAMIERAGALSLVVEVERLGSLRDLEPVLAAITAAEEHRVRVAAWEAARDEALGVLDRVKALTYRDDKPLPALGDAQRQAQSLHAELSGRTPEAPDEKATRQLPETTRRFSELLTLAEGWNALDDDRCAMLQDAITESFSRSLAVAALRGKLAGEGQASAPVPATRARVRTPAGQERVPTLGGASRPTPAVRPPVAPVVPPVATADEGEAVPVDSTPSAVAGAQGAPGAVDAEPIAATGGGLDAADAWQQAIPGGTTPARHEREDELERLALETAPWWVAARTGWQGLGGRGVGFGDAAQGYLEQFPYLLSVPLQRSAEYEGGRLAEGYALLLAHIDKQEEGFVQNAFTRLSPQFVAHAADQPYPLGQELYLYIVAEGRLYKTYPDFVREVFTHMLPRPGAWVQGGIVESDEETQLFMRSEEPGSTDEQRRTLTERKERLGPHLFRVSLGPLTTRFFTLRLAGETLADPPNVEIKLTENGAPTDHAWLITMPPLGRGPLVRPRKHRTGGTTLEELGPQLSGFWMAVFNADPRNDRAYEVSIILRRKPPPLPPDPKPGAKPAADHFFGKAR